MNPSKGVFTLSINKLQQAWQHGDKTLNGWIHIPNTWTAELQARCGFDSITIDMQHGMMGLETAIQMLQILSISDTVPMARVTWNEPGLIMRLLDAGALGIICPMINTPEECEHFVGACRYHPHGYRSLGPTRAKVVVDNYANIANELVLTIAMIETQEAVDNVEEIAKVSGLNGFYIGPGDLRQSLLGAGGIDVEDPEVFEAIDRVLAAAKANGLATGIHCGTVAYAHRMYERGFDFVSVGSDTVLIKNAAQAIVDQFKGAVPRVQKPAAY